MNVGQKRSTYREENYGFSIGGPGAFPKIYNGRNETFFFLNLEWDSQSTPDIITAVILSRWLSGKIL
jgi:hypothetical protein